MAKIRRNDHVGNPAYLCAKLVFEFFNNDNLDFKNESLRRVGKELRKEYNVSLCTVRDTYLDDPERAVLALALVGPSKSAAKDLADKVLAFLDSNMPGRLIDEDWTGDEL